MPTGRIYLLPLDQFAFAEMDIRRVAGIFILASLLLAHYHSAEADPTRSLVKDSDGERNRENDFPTNRPAH